jgi:hypothetical protein
VPFSSIERPAGNLDTMLIREVSFERIFEA